MKFEETFIARFCAELKYDVVSIQPITESQDYYVILNYEGQEVGYMVDIDGWVALNDQTIPQWHDEDTINYYWHGYVKEKIHDEKYENWYHARKFEETHRQDKEYLKWYNNNNLGL